MKARSRSSGLALILVLFLLALLVVVVYTFAYSVRVNLRLARNRAADLQMIALSRAGVEAAKSLLKNDAADNAYDWLGDKWAEPFPPLIVEGAIIDILITDEDRKINLNSLILDRPTAVKVDPELVRKETRIRIQRAIESLNLELNAQALADQIEARAAPAEESRPGTPEEGTTSLFVGSPFHSIEELLELGEKVDSKALYGDKSDPQAPKPGLCDVLTVASTGLVNLNTAPKEVLKALSEKMNDGMAQAIVDHRKEGEGFQHLEELARVPGLPEAVIESVRPLLTIRSSVFSLRVNVQRGEARRTIRCLLQRPLAGEETRRMPVLIPGLESIRVLRWDDLR